MNKINLAIVGATGLVGSKFLEVLEERNIEINNLYLYASERSENKVIRFRGKDYKVIKLNAENILDKEIDYALFSAGEKVSREFAPIFNKINAVVIDNSSAFRMSDNIPLIVPEVNAYKISRSDKIISNPNCSTIQCMPPLKVVDNLFKLRRVDYTTFQAVSGSGMKGIKDLENNLNGKQNEFYPHPILNNCLPHIGDFLDNSYTKEEIKMVKESQKILDLPTLQINATCVRVPVKNSHSVEMDIECLYPVDIDRLTKELSNFSGIKLIDNPKNNEYPLATDASGKDEILVGRIRLDLFDRRKLHIFCVADNIRKGAATNAIQILEHCILNINK